MIATTIGIEGWKQRSDWLDVRRFRPERRFHVRRLIPLFLLSVSVVFGSALEYTIDFYPTSGYAPASSSFSYDASAPAGSQFAGFDISWDSASVDLALEYAGPYTTPETQAELQIFGDALVSNTCASPTWSASLDFNSFGSITEDDFEMGCGGTNLYIGSTLHLSELTPVVSEFAGGTFAVCQSGDICTSGSSSSFGDSRAASTPEPGTAWLLPGAGLTICGIKIFRRRRQFRTLLT